MLSCHVDKTFNQIFAIYKPFKIELVIEIEIDRLHVTEGYISGTNVLSYN